MSVDPASVALPRGDVEFTMKNQGGAPLESTADSVGLFAWRDGQWSRIVQKTDELALESVTIPAGETREWSVSVNTADLASPYPPGEHDGEETFVLRLPPGTYALGYSVSRPGSDDDRTYARSFAVTGEAPPLETSSAHAETFRENGTRVVRTGLEEEFEHSRRVTLLVERVPASVGNVADLSLFELYNPGYELVPELGRDRVFLPGLLSVLLRDAFAGETATDERIRVETVDTTGPALGMHGQKTVRWRDDLWLISSREGWGAN